MNNILGNRVPPTQLEPAYQTTITHVAYFFVHISKHASFFIHGLIKLLVEDPQAALVSFTVFINLHSSSHSQSQTRLQMIVYRLNPQNISRLPPLSKS